MQVRQLEINKPFSLTCRWIFEHETLKEWKNKNRGLLWIRGNPGSGKSVLLKFLAEEFAADADAQFLKLSFFFKANGPDLQRSPLGLFRSLLHQLLTSVPEDLSDLVSFFDEQQFSLGDAGKRWYWEIQKLQEFLESSLSRILIKSSVLICIDALDECGNESAVEMVEYFGQLLSSRLPSSNFRCGIIFSCRHYPIFELHGGSSIQLEQENNLDIDSYIQNRLSGGNVRPEIKDIICRRAQGGFLWANLVANNVLRAVSDGKSDDEIRSEIEQVPQDLHDFYSNLVDSIRDRSEALKLLQWICFSTRPLKTDEMQWAMAINPENEIDTLEDCQQSNRFIQGRNIERRVKSLTRGLVETVLPVTGGTHFVQFIHQTVKEFFLATGLTKLNDKGDPKLLESTAHCCLSRSCISYLRMSISALSDSNHWDKSMLPLLHYAATSWISHTKLAEEAETPPSRIIDQFGLSMDRFVESWIKIYHQHEVRPVNLPLRGGNLLHIASQHGLSKVLSHLIQGTSMMKLDAKNVESQTPLLLATKKNQVNITRMLLETNKVDVNSTDNLGYTPLSWAAVKGYVPLVKMLLETENVQVDPKGNSKVTPLWLAARAGHSTVVHMLLQTANVDLDVRENLRSQTLLVVAADMGHLEVVDMLLATNRIDVNCGDKEGRTALHYATIHNLHVMTRHILQTKNVIVDAQDMYGRTPLHHAIINGYRDLVKIILDTASDSLKIRDNENRTPFIWACVLNRKGMIPILL